MVTVLILLDLRRAFDTTGCDTKALLLLLQSFLHDKQQITRTKDGIYIAHTINKHTQPVLE